MNMIHDLALGDRRIRGIRRIGRRGLSGACLEGILASFAPIVAVMDADLQHDEKCLAIMFGIIRADVADLVVASRYVNSGGRAKGLTRIRDIGSRLAVLMAQSVLQIRLTDPMSGFFMIRHDIIGRVAPHLSQQGFKVLLDIIASSSEPMRIREIPYLFNPRLRGESKLDASIVLDYLGLLITKASGDLISTRFLAFCLVSLIVMIFHLAFLRMLLLSGLSFSPAQATAMFIVTAFDFTLSNTLAYRDRRRSGWRFLSGFGMFATLCSFGLVAGVAMSTAFYESEPRWWLAGLIGLAVGTVWNCAAKSVVAWRAH
jgi:dolichol-phosphate mannosyltransferase